MAIKIPDFVVEIEDYEYASPIVFWTHGDRRYHFWLQKNGTRKDDVLHSNPIHRDPHRNEHRALNIASKKWRPLIDAIMAKIVSEGLVGKARQAAKEKAAAELADKNRKHRAERIARFDRAVEKLPKTLAGFLQKFSDDIKDEFVKSILNP